MPKRVRCHCGGDPECRLCRGTKVYDYTPGPRGWMPFNCPTCEGRGSAERGGERKPCPTCVGAGKVDPANPPTGRGLDMLWKTLFGA